MRYQGSKARIADQLWEVMKPYYKEGQTWVEPFIGGANMTKAVPPETPKVCGDSNKYITALHNAALRGWKPPMIGAIRYADIKKSPDLFKDEVVGFAGCLLSFRGTWFGGFVRGKRKGNKLHNYVEQAYRDYKKHVTHMTRHKDITIYAAPYNLIEFPPNSLIYCDPPYQGTTGYKDNFDHEQFFCWCRHMASLGHTVFVSEYNAPSDFKTVFSSQVSNYMSSNSVDPVNEKLFIAPST